MRKDDGSKMQKWTLKLRETHPAAAQCRLRRAVQAFRQRLSGGIQDLSEPVVEELLLDWQLGVVP